MSTSCLINTSNWEASECSLIWSVFFFPKISFKFLVLCSWIYPHDIWLKHCSFTPLWIISKWDLALTLTFRNIFKSLPNVQTQVMHNCTLKTLLFTLWSICYQLVLTTTQIFPFPLINLNNCTYAVTSQIILFNNIFIQTLYLLPLFHQQN